MYKYLTVYRLQKKGDGFELAEGPALLIRFDMNDFRYAFSARGYLDDCDEDDIILRFAHEHWLLVGQNLDGLAAYFGL